VTWRIVLTPTARAQLAAVKDRRTREKIAACIERLAENPEIQGKPLVGDLRGVYSLRASGQRFRILYRVEAETVMVIVLALGLRKAGDKKDVYELARRLLKVGLLQEPEKSYAAAPDEK
jgi:mRNA interferase RelE/StbE